MRGIAALIIIAVAMAVATPSGAQSPKGFDAPALLRADEVRFDHDKNIVIAEGNVEVTQGDRILLANSISYDLSTGTVTATGDVVILEPTGETIFASTVVLQDNLRNGVVEDFRLRFPDNTRVAANGARRSGGNRTEMSKAVFSPCQDCPKHPNRPPLWQLRASRIVHKQDVQRVDYYDAWLEIYGVPVAYTPFFSHPDPTVKRKSGFLAPKYGSSSLLGLKLQTPYYWSIAPDKDATFTPLFTSDEGVVLAGEYRQRLRQGYFEFSASVTRPRARDDNGDRLSGRDTRGHIFGEGRFAFARGWRAGFNVERATDDTYLRRYDIQNKDTLTSQLFVEGFRGRNYFGANAYAFQGLRREDESDLFPTIWPIIQYSFVGQPSRFGGRFSLDANVLQLTRRDGTDSRRLSISGGWRLPYTSRLGEVYTLSVDMRGDIYLVDQDIAGTPSGDFSGITGRFQPRAALDWRYPFVRDGRVFRMVIEPIASFVVSPFGGNSANIPNEDSVSFEFDDTNLFSHERFPGLDRVESGPRFGVGIKAGFYGPRGISGTVLFGQAFRTKADDNIPGKTGLETTRSDYVGRISVTLGPYFDYVHRFRLDRSNFGFSRNEIELSLGPPARRLTVGFVSLSRELSAEEAQTRRELRAIAHFQLTRRWSADASWRRDLGDDGGNISAAFGVVYEDECIRFTSSIRRDFTRDRDIEPSTSLNFHIALKHLG